MMSEREYRAFEFEVRAEESEEHGHYLTGVPIVFGQETHIGGWLEYDEVIDRSALENCDLRDVRFLVGHNASGIPLARSRNNNEHSTMQMTIEDDGLHIRVDLDTENNAEAKTLYSATQRGDISGMSFAFTVDGYAWERLEDEDSVPLRRITSIKRVYEVSAVAFPAYEGTSLEAKSENAEALDSVRASLESAKAELAAKRAAENEAARRDAAIARLKKFREVIG